MPEWQSVDEPQLLKEAQCGNAEAFGELYERYAPQVFRFLYAHLDSALDAEDLTEEVFLKAWYSMGRFRDQGLPFRAFLLRVAHNRLVDFYRRAHLTDKPVLKEMEFLPDTAPGPDIQVDNQFEHQKLRQALKQLREDYQTVLAARYLAGLSAEETAQAMGKSVGAVRVLQHRALAALRKLFPHR